jgi:glucokinase
MKACVLGIDVGGTKIAAGLLAWPEGRAVSSGITPTQAPRGGRVVLDDVLRLARYLVDEGQTRGVRVDAIGIGICELVDRDGRIASTNCIQWQAEPVQEELSSIAPTVIEADVRAAALAEALFGAGKPFRNFLYLSVGTGISCCLMLDGVPYLGARGASGTMASSPLSVPCEKCGHIGHGSLEEIASGPALVTRFQAAGGSAKGAQEVVAAAAAGNAAARQIIESASEALGSQTGVLVSSLDPEAVIVGGGLGLSEGQYWEHFVAATRRHIWSDVHRNLPILRAATGENAGWIGAAAKAGQYFQKQLKLTKP